MVAEMGRAGARAVYAAGLNRRHHPPCWKHSRKERAALVGRKGT